MNLISNIFGFLKEILGFTNKRTDLKNAPDVKAAAKANQENANVEVETKAVAEKNVAKIREELSE